MLTEIHVCEKLLSKQVRRSTKFLYLEMMLAACTYLLSQEYKDKEIKVDDLEWDVDFES